MNFSFVFVCSSSSKSEHKIIEIFFNEIQFNLKNNTVKKTWKWRNLERISQTTFFSVVEPLLSTNNTQNILKKLKRQRTNNNKFFSVLNNRLHFFSGFVFPQNFSHFLITARRFVYPHNFSVHFPVFNSYIYHPRHQQINRTQNLHFFFVFIFVWYRLL